MAGETTTIDVRVSAGTDDAEERTSGGVNVTSSDLELVDETSNNTDQTVGIRFNGLEIPPGSVIVNAYLQFQVDETDSAATLLNIVGQDTGDAATFANTDFNISSRETTQALADWTPAAWTTVGEAGLDQRTPDLSAIIQEIIDRSDWSASNSMAFIITGSGARTAESYNGNAAAAPLLHIEFAPSGEPANQAPTDIDLSAAAVLEGAADGTLIGTLGGVTDPDATDTHGFTLLDDAGGRFIIVGDELRVADGTLLDFEAASSHDVTVRVTDSGSPALVFDKIFTITVGDTNDAPELITPIGDTTAVTGTAFSHAVAANFADDDTTHGDSLIYSATLSDGGALPGWLAIDPATGVLSGTSTNADIGVIEITVTATDAFGPVGVTDTFLISVTETPNLAPTDFGLSAAAVTEDAAAGTVIGNLGAVADPDAGDTHGFTLLDDAGGRFTIVGDELRVADGGLLDFETVVGHDVTVRVTDSGTPALGYDETFTITVGDVNEAPTDFVLSAAQVAENAVSGSVIGTFGGAIDQDAGDTHGFALLDDAGGRFILVGDELRVADDTLLDFETAASHDVTVRVIDGGTPGLSLDKTFTITVGDVNEAPSEFTLNANQVVENSANGTLIGTLGGAVDQDAGDSHGFSIVDDAGGRFTVVGGELRVAEGTLLDFETAASHDLIIRVTDSGNPALSYDKSFTVNLSDANDAPSDFTLTWTEVSEHAPIGTLVGSLAGLVDQDAGDSHGFTLIDDAGGRFSLVGDQLIVANDTLLDLATAASHDVILRATDDGAPSLSLDKVITISVRGANVTPSDFTLSTGSVVESATTGTVVATLVGVLDLAIGGTHDFVLVDDAGGRFKIVGDELLINDESLVDFETATSHDVVIRATNTSDPTLELDKTFTITVDDVPETTFMVVAVSPYWESEIPVLTDYLSDVPDEVEFVIHLGDVTNGSSKLMTAEYFDEVSSILQTSSVPLFIVLGDNEYNDSDDPVGAFSLWSDEFTYFDQNWTHDIGVTYQDIRPENFSFVLNDTLFVGINLVGGYIFDADEWASRSADDLVWVEDMFTQYGDVASNAVIFAHASPSWQGYTAFKQGFITVDEEFVKPILHLQGDQHDWTLTDPYAGVENITNIIMDRTGPGEPLLVSIVDDALDPFSSDHNFNDSFL